MFQNVTLYYCRGVEQQTVRRRRSNTEAAEGDAGVHEATSVREAKNYYIIVAGWSSSVARWAHNPKVAGSNPAPATKWSRGVAVNMPACHAGDRRFDPGRDRHFYLNTCGSVAQLVEH